MLWLYCQTWAAYWRDDGGAGGRKFNFASMLIHTGGDDVEAGGKHLTLLHMLFNNCAIGYMSCQRNETAIMHLEIYFISLTWIILSHKTSVSSDALARSKCLKLLT